ncbi:hybrid sensor histidine kinase/response regulator [Crocosphaera sp. XPORK-15E]|uniref:hybrid sensor histidine kinase/response regulator n=1 Tax=Crocosphaera sp. XPORK-15E TaxID=3110247 RepID=UPI002B1F0E27|nr:hybrid sensor histidine kinase/response regulator [Crocosphaera sp. XPORK-15E]MEA5536286.1 hybrid sensor histidine kinase/response regulator [Crocosphaera sp. XPORK-15E]
MLNPDIRDQAYQFFIEEAPELLQIIETGLLTLKEERSTPKVHEIMRAAHSIKGGAASVELNTIKILAHRIEDIFKALYDETVEIDNELESLLLQAYDSLRNPLIQQIEQGSFDEEAAITAAMPILEALESILGDSLAQGDQYMPSSADLGIDIVSSLFEVDVAQGLEQLQTAIATNNNAQIAQELRNQGDVFQGFAELLSLPGFGAIAQTAIEALDKHPEAALTIATLALKDFQESHHLVLVEGDRTSGGQPSEDLLTLAQGQILNPVNNNSTQVNTKQILSLDDLFQDDCEDNNQEVISYEMVENNLESLEVTEEDSFNLTALEDSDFFNTPPLDDVFGGSLSSVEETDFSDAPLLDDVFGEAISLTEASDNFAFSSNLDDVFGNIEESSSKSLSLDLDETESRENIDNFIESVEDIFDKLLPLEEQINSFIPVQKSKVTTSTNSFHSTRSKRTSKSRSGTTTNSEKDSSEKQKAAGSNLSVRVDFNRIEKMNNLVGELVINRNSLSLQNDQLQGRVKELLNRFSYFQKITGTLRQLSDQMLVAPERYGAMNVPLKSTKQGGNLATDFDSLEMDSYGTVYSIVQSLVEEMMQLEESVDDIVLFARASNQTLEQQRQMLTNLRDELMWARMLPLGEVLNRFPRVLRDLSTTYHKPVKLKLTGTGVLVDKAALEKLYDPLLHLLRNGFDHGIEPPEIRRKLGKPEQGQIEIRAYHQGNQTIVEIKDDGGGLNLEKIAQKAVTVGLVTPEQVAVMSKEVLQNLIFEPGFSTATQVSELSGRGVGLDVVREQLQVLKGMVSVSSISGKGTTFTLRLPLTLTIAKLLVCLINNEGHGQTSAVALPSDSIEEIIMPEPEQIKKSGNQRFLSWQRQIIPIYPLSHLLDYRCTFPDGFTSKALQGISTPHDWGLPLLILRQGEQLYALEVNRLVTEQELVIKPFGKAMASPAYTYGCTILGDGTLIPVINGSTLMEQTLDPIHSDNKASGIVLDLGEPKSSVPAKMVQNHTVLVVDDSAALRRTLALTLQKAGYRVLQARDGRDALDQLQQSSAINLVICDVEMPNMNGFEFLGQRRRDPELMKIPVAMLTSRSSEKHRQLATHLGASAYFTKPYIEQQFLETVKNMITQ